ncbi:PEP-CTERM sorting domain-containing protein [Pontiella agarivorans]|uniref:PEP-CTERM sorting domain-containing protein n=1 Tax=Pontiella agarivorans TaxID=3038953 RepID=A0ABU5MY47_9BACT|nr:PEP-CTERM sorting domain-containing protein [Pontiella agarivorans]MDZ8119140.1 PEP-CTERM sorting domain-containing protein [Pontiella agarivorans]
MDIMKNIGVVALVLLAAMSAGAGVIYSTDFDATDFSNGSLNGQDGWWSNNNGAQVDAGNSLVTLPNTYARGTQGTGFSLGVNDSVTLTVTYDIANVLVAQGQDFLALGLATGAENTIGVVKTRGEAKGTTAAGYSQQWRAPSDVTSAATSVVLGQTALGLDMPADDDMVPITVVWTATKTGTADTFDINLEAFDGTTSLGSQTATIVDNAAYTAGTLYAGYQQSVNGDPGSVQLLSWETAVIPEPATLGLVAMAGVGIISLRRIIM